MRLITLKKNIYFLFFWLCFFSGLGNLSAQCPTIANTNQSFCDIQSPTVASLVAANTGGGVVWYATATSTTPLAPGSGLVNGEDYFADSTVNSCGVRPSVVVTIYSAPIGQNFQGVCVDIASNATIADLIAVGNNIQWYSVPNNGIPLPSTTVLMDNTIYYASQTNPNTNCETSRLSVFVNVGVVPVPTGAAIQEFCNLPGDVPTIADLVVSGTTNNWYATVSSAVPLDPSTPLVNGQSYFATSVDPPCESDNRLEVTVVFVAPNDPGTNGIRNICQNLVATTAPFNLFGLLGGTPDTGGIWTGPLATANGHLGTVNVSTLTVAGSPYVFTYTVSSSLCPQSSSTVTITILPTPTVTISASPTTVCSGTAATVTFTGTPNATVTYTVNNGPNQTIVLNASGTATITGTYTTATTYTLISAASAGTPSCVQPQTGSVTINVVSLPTAVIAANATVCSGGTGTVTFTGTPNATVTYTINNGPNQTIVLNASGTTTITGTYTATTVYTLVSVASAGSPSCTRSLTGSVTITVIPLPIVSISVSAANVCQNGTATVTFTGTPNAVVTYVVNSGPNQTITLSGAGTATITTTYAATTTYTLVSVTTTGTPSCSQPQTGSVTVNVVPPPTGSASVNVSTICSGASATATFTGTPNATVTYTINNGPNQTIVLNASGTATLAGTYTATTTITLISVATSGTPSCSTPLTTSVMITVIPPPVVTVSVNANPVCSGAAATVTFSGPPNATVIYTVNNGPNQTIVLNASGTATITGTYTTTTILTLISATTAGIPACTQPQTGSVTITVLPPPTATVSVSANTVCSGNPVTVTFTGTPNATVTYTINNGPNQTIVLNSSGTATLAGTYTANTTITLVSITSSGTPSCTQPLSGSVTITVITLPTASVAVNIASICSGQSAIVTFTGTPNATVTYTVNNGPNQTIVLNGSGTATLTGTYTATTVYTLVSVTTSGTPSCSQPLTQSVTITVIPPPTASISVSANPVCASANAIVTFTGTPNATVTYTVNNGPNQTIVLNASGTATLTGTYTANTTITLVSVTTSGTPGCTQPLNTSLTISVLPLPTASISINADTVCAGGSSTITFTGTPNATVTYTVNNGPNQTILLNAGGTATLPGTYTATTTITLVSVATSGTPSCSQPLTASVTVTVVPPPTVALSVNTNTVCSGQNATVTFTGTPNATVTYTINTVTQTIVLDATGTATLSGSYTTNTTITLVSAVTTGTPGCSAPQTGSVIITVVPPPTASVSLNAPSVCLGNSSTITFTGTPNATVTYTINNGPNQTIVLNASGTATLIGNYTVNTTITLVSVTTSGPTACVQPLTASVTITVVPPPTITISIVGSTSVCSGSSASVVFTGTPNAVVTYTVNNGPNQTITLNGAGTATINPTLSTTTTYTLVSVASAGPPVCSQPQTGSVQINVTAAPVAGNDVANLQLCTNSGLQNLFTLLGTSAQPGGTWSPALASGTGIFNPAVDSAGTYIYTVAGTGPCPNDTASVTVTLTLPPNAGNDNTLTICSNANPTDLFALLGASAQAGGTWAPTLASGTGFFDPAVDVAGPYTYSVTGTGPCGNDTAVVSVSITPGPDAGQDGNITLCTNSAPEDLFDALNGTPQAGGTWSPALASGTGVFDPMVDAPGNYTYTFFGNQPCDNDTAVVTVVINPVPDAGDDGVAQFCTNDPSEDLILSLGGTPQAGGTWTPALASGSGIFNPLLDAGGVYTYTVGGGLCSTDVATVTVTVNQSPIAGADGALNTCVNLISLDLTTGLDGTQQAGTFADDDASGALSGTIFNPSVAGPGTYHFTYTVGGGVSPCLFDTAVVTVTVAPLPNAGTFIGTQPAICSSVGTFDLFTLLIGNQSGGTWTDGTGTPVTNPVTISGFTGGTYSFTYTINNTCGTDAEIVQLTVLPTPIITNANVSVAAPVCQGQNTIVNFSSMADGNYTVNYSISGSNVLDNQTILLTIASGIGSFQIPAAALPNTGNTTITFNTILNNASNCSNTLTNVTAAFTVNPLSNLDSANLSIANACLGSAAFVIISGAAGLPDGDYQFHYDIPGLSPSNGVSGTVTMTGGSGQFSIIGTVFPIAGTYTLTITSIISLSSGCSNFNENAAATFEIIPVPDATGATIDAADSCLNFSNEVFIANADNLADGTYTINYQLSGANTVSGTVTVTITSGDGSFTIPAAELANAGSTTVTITQLTTGTSTCGTNGSSFNTITFEVDQLGTPVLNPQGEEFCATDNPTIADLSANVNGTDPVTWYDAAIGGTAYTNTDLLQNGMTYYGTYVAASGCESPSRLPVLVDLTVCDELLIPDGFSPNGDNINDEFVIINLPELYPNFKLEIYNRYGNILYKGNINTPNWNGTSSEGGVKVGDNVVPVGVYFYILEFNDGTRKPVQGRLYLSR